MIIKILGTGCPTCKALEKRVHKVIDNHHIDAEVIKVEEIMDILEYKIMSTPGLVVNEQVVSKGRIPSESEILSFLTH